MWRQSSFGLPVQSTQDETLTQVFLTHLASVFFCKQNYPTTLAMLYRKFLREENTIIRCFVWICDLPEIGCPVVKVESLYFQFLSFFTEPILADF